MESLYIAACGMTDMLNCHYAVTATLSVLDQYVTVIGTWQALCIIALKR
jgi:hypothetical protein